MSTRPLMGSSSRTGIPLSNAELLCVGVWLQPMSVRTARAHHERLMSMPTRELARTTAAERAATMGAAPACPTYLMYERIFAVAWENGCHRATDRGFRDCCSQRPLPLTPHPSPSVPSLFLFELRSWPILAPPGRDSGAQPITPSVRRLEPSDSGRRNRLPDPRRAAPDTDRTTISRHPKALPPPGAPTQPLAHLPAPQSPASPTSGRASDLGRLSREGRDRRPRR